ncbi:hypothetical protein J7M22_05515 [Candidatus Poribacteria bacterium]|nr:hypothetical protein [Candidatus Poribacteria bacterium]
MKVVLGRKHKLLILPLLLLLSYAYAEKAETIFSGKCVMSVTPLPSKPVIYMGTVNKGLYRSEDGGRSWGKIGKGIDPLAWIYSIAIDPKDNRILYIGTEGGVYKSTDGGESWVRLDLKTTVFSIVINPLNPKIIYAGKFKSEDGGRRWDEMSNLPTLGSPAHLAIDPKRPEILYAISAANVASSPAHTFKSVNSGEDWRKISDDLIYQVAVDPYHTDILYACGREGVYKSVDGGERWRLMRKGLVIPRGWFVRRILIDPINPDVIYAGIAGVNASCIYMSEDGGESWFRLGVELEGSVNGMAISPCEPSHMVVGSSNGAWRLELPERKPYQVNPPGKLLIMWGRMKLPRGG